jgi:RimJ/RimL family protein N-acetyltransferase
VGDALTRHFLLVHPASLSRRFVLPDGRGVAAVCRTSGGPLPLVVFRSREDDDIPPLLARALDPIAKHYFITRPAYRAALPAFLRDSSDEEETMIHTVEPRLIRERAAWAEAALVKSAPGEKALGEARLEAFTRRDPLTGADLHGCRVVIGGREVSSARVEWCSGGYAEVGVSTAPEHQRRGYARAATGALAARLVGLGLTPLYIAGKLNTPSLALAASLGFLPSGEGEFACSGFRPATSASGRTREG